MFHESVSNEGCLSEVAVFNDYHELILQELHLGEGSELSDCSWAFYKQQNTGGEACKVLFKFQQVCKHLTRLVPLVCLLSELNSLEEVWICLYFVFVEVGAKRVLEIVEGPTTEKNVVRLRQNLE